MAKKPGDLLRSKISLAKKPGGMLRSKTTGLSCIAQKSKDIYRIKINLQKVQKKEVYFLLL